MEVSLGHFWYRDGFDQGSSELVVDYKSVVGPLHVFEFLVQTQYLQVSYCRSLLAASYGTAARTSRSELSYVLAYL